MSETLQIEPIGVVESSVKDPVDEAWGCVTSKIILRPEYAPGLLGLDAFSHVIVVTYLHQASFDPSRHLQRRPRGLEQMPKVGIFSQRAKDRIISGSPPWSCSPLERRISPCAVSMRSTGRRSLTSSHTIRSLIESRRHVSRTGSMSL